MAGAGWLVAAARRTTFAEPPLFPDSDTPNFWLNFALALALTAIGVFSVVRGLMLDREQSRRLREARLSRLTRESDSAGVLYPRPEQEFRR